MPHRVLALGSLILFSIIAAGQEPQAPFVLKVNTQLVVQTVSVKDSDGSPIEGLTGNDFIVTEDGVPQTISVFEFQKIDDTLIASTSPRLRPAADEPVQSPVVASLPSVATGFTQYSGRRLLVLYFDMTAMRGPDLFRALASAQRFIETHMTAADLVSIMTFGGVVTVRQDFTDNPSALLETISALMHGDDEADAAADPEAAFGQNAGEFNIFRTDRQLSGLQTAVKMLGSLNEHKSLVYFSSGLRMSGTDNQAQLRATLNAAIRGNVSLYPVDSRGLLAQAPSGDARQASPGGIGMYTGATATSALSSFQRSQDALSTLAGDTGGKAMLDYNDLTLGIVNAQRTTSSYYILGYYPTNTTEDGRFRRVRISLKSRQAKLSYRDGYYANKEFSKFTASDKERQLEEALMLGDPITDLTIAMELNYFQLNRAEYFVPLAVKIPGSELVLAQKVGAERTLIDFIGEIRDEYGTAITNLRDKVEIKVKGEAADRLASIPVQYDAGFTLLPGKYVIKFLARNAETGRIGTYQTTFTVPNLNKEELRLPISSVVLSSQRVEMSDALFNAGKNKAARDQAANPLVEDGEKLIPSITRVFSKNKDLYVYLQAYQKDATSTQQIIAFVTFYRGEEKVFETSPFSITEAFDSGSKAVPVRLTVSLAAIPIGEYRCQVTVLHPTAHKLAFWHAPVMILP